MFVSPSSSVLPEPFEAFKIEEKPIENVNYLDETRWQDLNNYETFATKNEPDEEMKVEVHYIFHHAIIALAIHLIHVAFGPASLPVLWFFFGNNLCTNMGFNWHPFYIFEFVSWFWVLLTVIYFILFPEQFSSTSSLIISTSTIITLRLLLVSIKYGYYTEKNWKMMRNEKIDIKSLTKYLLIASWLTIPTDLIIEEHLKSYKRLNRFPNSLFLKFESGLPMKIKERINKNEESEDHCLKFNKKETNCISTIALTEILIELSNNRAISKIEMRIIDVFAGLYTFFPIVLSLFSIQFDNSLEGIFGVAYAVFSMIISFIFTNRFLLYIYVGIVDMKRRKFLMKQCAALISCQELDRSFPKEYRLPSLDFTDLRTIDSWYNMRAACLDFGRTYTHRTFVYSSLVLPLCIFIILGIILQFFGAVNFSVIISKAALASIIFLSFISLSEILYIIIVGSQVNDSFDLHKDLIVTLSNDILHLRENTDAKNSILYQALMSVYYKLEQDDRVRPVRIMGFKANSGFMLNLGALFWSGVLSLVQFVYTSDNLFCLNN
ncbi:unnamed protein product [Blepharisma stoltei]|uniref:Odorant receptor n=1 Tax=Blepharisma stoltei TaxID=1481888 RepID=A0AAU9J592_9CILI|nr:unnamed protein product [Blepharisma stoltei]